MSIRQLVIATNYRYRNIRYQCLNIIGQTFYAYNRTIAYNSGAIHIITTNGKDYNQDIKVLAWRY
jgi:hypothetical protein